MWDSKPWSNSPNAPQIPHWVYFAEKTNFIGHSIGAMFHGIATILFFQCMGALFNPVNRSRGGIKWPLVAHTVAMYSFVTINNAMSFDLQSISYIDDREYPGQINAVPPGPLGYQEILSSNADNVVPNIMFLLTSWLADGLLLYRCHIIFANNYWVIAFPCLMYLASVSTGIMFTYQTLRPQYFDSQELTINLGLSFFSISVSLNVLLTLMIIVRLVMHSRNVRKATGAPEGAGGLYKAIVTVLVESCALYAVGFLLYIGVWSVGNALVYVFFPILLETQVIAPFLIVLRVAKQRALTSASIVSGNVDTICFRSQGESTATGGDGTESLPSGDTLISMDGNRETPGGRRSVGAESAVDEVSI